MSSIKVKPPKKIDFNIFTGELDLTVDNNFSYFFVPLNQKLTIYAGMQMAVFSGLYMDGVIDLMGTIILEP